MQSVVLALLFGAAGCQVLFPLTADDAGPDVGPPQVTLSTSSTPVIAQEPTDIELAIIGQQDRGVSYQLGASAGMLAAEEGSVVLTDPLADGLGRAIDSVEWMPPDDYVAVTLDAFSGYDAAVDLDNQAGLVVPVHKRFGPGKLTRFVSPLNTTKILAQPISIGPTSPGTVTSISLTVVSIESAVMASLGLYEDITDDNGSRPGERKLEVSMFPIIEPGVVEHGVSLDIDPGKYWVALLVDARVDLEGENPGAAVTASHGGGLAMPAMFPTLLTPLDSDVGLRVTVAPR